MLQQLQDSGNNNNLYFLPRNGRGITRLDSTTSISWPRMKRSLQFEVGLLEANHLEIKTNY